MNCNVNGELASTEEVPACEGVEDSGVVEVMASPDSDGPFTEEMINQVITMLQTEGQITPETHTVIVHTNNGTTLKVQLQQVDGTELENDNIEELAPDAVATEDDQLVYVGQAGEEYQTDLSGHHHHLQQQQYAAATTTSSGATLQILEPQQQISQHQHVLHNGNQFMTVAAGHEQHLIGHEPVTSVEYKAGVTEEVGIPASLMSNVAEQVLQAATLMDGGYKNASTVVATNSNTGMVMSNDIITTADGVTFQQQPIDLNGDINAFPQSLENGVSWSIGTQQLQSVYSTPVVKGNLHQVNSVPVVSQDRHSVFKSNKINHSTQYTTSNCTQQADNYLDNNDVRSPANSSSFNVRRAQSKPVKAHHTIEENVIRIFIDTGRNDVHQVNNLPSDVIRISTTTGLPKIRSAKFVRCPACVMQLSSEAALLQHMRHGCPASRKKRTSYECTYCSAKFSSKVRTVEHLKVCTMRTQVRSISKNQSVGSGSVTGRVMNRKPTTQTVEVEINSDEDEANNNRDEENIVYDDDDDIDMDLAADNEDYETQMSKVSQKHLGPILVGGKFKCRDCDRTFNKDSQYNRHIGACTNAPLNASRIDDPEPIPVPERKPSGMPEKKRGRPRKVYPDGKSVAANKVKPASSVKAYSKAVARPSHDAGKDDLSDLDWDFMAAPKKPKISDRGAGKKSNIMQVLKQNLGDEDFVDGSKDLSESFLQCLDGSLTNEGDSSKGCSPSKSASAVCGLCVRHMNSADELAMHIGTVHAKDIVNMHAILTNNTDLTTHKCSMCDLHFVSAESVREHIIAKHLPQLKDSYRSLIVNSLDLPCPWCDYKSMTKELFQQHLASEHSQHFPEAALNAPVLKPEEISHQSLKSAALSLKEPHQEPLALRLCQKCGLAISSRAKLEEHLKSCKTDMSSGLHKCVFPDCPAPAFDSLALLIAHTEEEHCVPEGCEHRLFPNMSLFTTWLEHEERVTEQKYVKATSRLRGGCCYSTYLCPNYNSLDKRSSATCFARLHVRTRWCRAKFDYCGRTEVMFYKEHHHPKDDDAKSDIISASKELEERFRASNQSAANDAVSANNNADDDPTSKSEASLLSPAKRDDASPEEEHKEPKTSDLPEAEEPSSPGSSVNNNNDAEYLGANNNKSARNTAAAASKASKLNKSKPPACNNKRPRDENDSDEDFYPLSKKKGGRNANNLKNKTNSRKGAGNKYRNSGSEAPSKKRKIDEQEETTYVLPANLSEWCKLFDMVQGQINSGLIKKSDVAEARSLLKHQNDITELALEEQVRVFHRLCSLANIQVD